MQTLYVCVTLLIIQCAAALALSRAGFGSAGNTVRIFLDNVHCIGNERRLTDCQHGPVGTHNCGHLEDASVICQGVSTTSGAEACLLASGCVVDICDLSPTSVIMWATCRVN